MGYERYFISLINQKVLTISVDSILELLLVRQEKKYHKNH